MEDALQLRFAETEARIGVKVDEFERQLNWTQRLMGEIQYEMDVRKRPRKDKEAAAMAATPELEVATTLEPEAAATPEPEVAATAEPRVVVAVEQRPATPPIATQPPATKEEAWIKPLKQPDHSNNTVAVPPPAIAMTDQTISFTYRQCQACGQSCILPQCTKCLQWTHPSCPELPQPCSCTPIIAAKKPIPVAASSAKTLPVAQPQVKTSSNRRSSKLVHFTTRCKEKISPGAEARKRVRAILRTNLALVREIFQRQHELAAARTDPVLVCKQTVKGLWTPQDDDLVQYKLVGHSGKSKPKQSFQVRWKSVEIGQGLLRSGPNEMVISPLFQDPRDTTAVFHALNNKLSLL